MAGVPTYEATNGAGVTSPRVPLPDTSDIQAWGNLGGVFQGLGERLVKEAEAGETQQAELLAKAQPVYREDGTLAPLDLKVPLGASNRAYNAFRISAYAAEIENQAGMKAREIATKNPYNPDAFTAEYRAYIESTARAISDPTIATMMAPRLGDIGKKTQLGINEKVMQRGIEDQKQSVALAVGQKQNQLNSWLRQGGDPGSPEVQARIDEIEGLMKPGVDAGIFQKADVAKTMFNVRDDVFLNRVIFEADQLRKRTGSQAQAHAYIEQRVRAAGDELYGDRDRIIKEAEGQVDHQQSDLERSQRENYDKLQLALADGREFTPEQIKNMPIGDLQKSVVLKQLEAAAKAATTEAEKEEKAAIQKKIDALSYEYTDTLNSSKPTEAVYLKIERELLSNREKYGSAGAGLLSQVRASRKSLVDQQLKDEAVLSNYERGFENTTTGADAYTRAHPQASLAVGDLDTAIATFRARPALDTKSIGMLKGAAMGAAGAENLGKAVRFIQSTAGVSDAMRDAVGAAIGAENLVVLEKVGTYLDANRTEGGPKIDAATAVDKARAAVRLEAQGTKTSAAVALSDTEIDRALDGRGMIARNLPFAAEVVPGDSTVRRAIREHYDYIQGAGAGATMTKEAMLAQAVAHVKTNLQYAPSTFTQDKTPRWTKQAPEAVTGGDRSGLFVMQLQMAEALVNTGGFSPQDAAEYVRSGKAFPQPVGTPGKEPAWTITFMQPNGISQPLRERGPNGETDGPKLVLKYDRARAQSFENTVVRATPDLSFALGNPYAPDTQVPDLARWLTEPVVRNWMEGQGILGWGQRAARDVRREVNQTMTGGDPDYTPEGRYDTNPARNVKGLDAITAAPPLPRSKPGGTEGVSQ